MSCGFIYSTRRCNDKIIHQNQRSKHYRSPNGYQRDLIIYIFMYVRMIRRGPKMQAQPVQYQISLYSRVFLNNPKMFSFRIVHTYNLC